MSRPDELPWLRFYGRVPESLEYPATTLYEAVAATARRVPDALAWDFLGTTATYRQLIEQIECCAGALAALGLERGERMLISMPTSRVRTATIRWRMAKNLRMSAIFPRAIRTFAAHPAMPWGRPGHPLCRPTTISASPAIAKQPRKDNRPALRIADVATHGNRDNSKLR